MKYSNKIIGAGCFALTADSITMPALLWGLLGVTAFSLTLPATKMAVASIDGFIVGLGRAVVAAACAGILLKWTGQSLPRRALRPRLALVAAGVVIGFPLLSALAMQTVPSSHGAIVVGLLPAATALMGVLRGHERPSAGFFLAATLGLVAILSFCATSGLGRVHTADVLLFSAVLLAALGYSEGALLAREIGSWQVISWALVLSAPVLAPVVATRVFMVGWAPSAASLAGFAYVSFVSMFLGFFAWYRGLASGGIARVGQLQLVQPVMTLGWSHLFLGESVTGLQSVTAGVVLLSVWAALRLRVRSQTPHGLS